ncbi:MAG: alpha/beta fold hydrolase [Rhizobiales bacterium]|nr:alpha/beta fold hydrolase [Hyphomicrobiales bacterium]
MPYATTPDNVRLYYEEAGSGTPILFVHEFAGDHRGWEPQMRYFARSHRCIAYSARGYVPSDVPNNPDAYSYRHFMRDVVAVLDHLGLPKAHVVGLSMGGYTTLQVGLSHPDRALSLTLAGIGSGSERWLTEEFRHNARATAELFESKGSAEVARTYGIGPGRVPFAVKDPRGFKEFSDRLAEHDARGSANTMRTFQGERPSVYDFEDGIRRLSLPTLIVVGDEDDPCVEPSLFLKQWIAASGLAVLPKTGHVVNLEEPDLFNRTLAEFLARVEAGRWPPRDPRSLRPPR